MADEPLTGELIDAKLIAKHTKYKVAYEKGLANACMALYKIRTEETFVVDGHNTFTEFLQDWVIGRTQGYALAAAGPVFRLLEKADMADAVTSLDQLKPISKMAPERQVAVIQLAQSKAPTKRGDGKPRLTKF